MNKSKLIKCAQKIARTPGALHSLKDSTVKQAAARKYVDAVKALYQVKVASVDLMDQAQRDPELASLIINQAR